MSFEITYCETSKTILGNLILSESFAVIVDLFEHRYSASLFYSLHLLHIVLGFLGAKAN